MNVAAITARVDEIQQMVDTLRTRVAPVPATDPTAFSAALGSATTASVPVPPVADPQAAAPLAPVTAPAAAPGGTPNSPFSAEISAAASRHGVDPALLTALVRQESNFNPAARSPAGATGLTQLMPGTAASLGVTDATDPAQALDGGAKYLRQQLDAFGGDERKALAAYNAGPGAVTRFGGIPPYAETQQYVEKVLGYAAEYRAAAPPAAVPAPAPEASAVPTGSLSYTTT